MTLEIRGPHGCWICGQWPCPTPAACVHAMTELDAEQERWEHERYDDPPKFAPKLPPKQANDEPLRRWPDDYDLDLEERQREEEN